MEPARAIDSEANLFNWQRTDPYRFFAFAFAPPSRERHEWFSQAGTEEILKGLWRELSGKKFPGFPWFRDYESYESAYIATFDVGAPEAPVPLFESAHNKKRPAQELVLENTYFYEVLGLRVDASRSTPDHLLSQLEFLSAVAFARDCSCQDSQKCNLLRLERDFLRRHLFSWLGKADRKLRKCGIPAFSILFSLMILSLHHQLQRAVSNQPIAS